MFVVGPVWFVILVCVGWFFWNLLTQNNQHASSATLFTHKICPFCKTTIVWDAIKCPYCHEKLQLDELIEERELIRKQLEENRIKNEKQQREFEEKIGAGCTTIVVICTLVVAFIVVIVNSLNIPSKDKEPKSVNRDNISQLKKSLEVYNQKTSDYEYVIQKDSPEPIHESPVDLEYIEQSPVMNSYKLSERSVYIDDSTNIYHLNTCGEWSAGMREVTIKEAIKNENLKPCRLCKPNRFSGNFSYSDNMQFYEKRDRPGVTHNVDPPKPIYDKSLNRIYGWE